MNPGASIARLGGSEAKADNDWKNGLHLSPGASLLQRTPIALLMLRRLVPGGVTGGKSCCHLRTVAALFFVQNRLVYVKSRDFFYLVWLPPCKGVTLPEIKRNYDDSRDLCWFDCWCKVSPEILEWYKAYLCRLGEI